ncbi:UNVERIFIED_CONTAM: hypothetical protein K2H54_026984 [Gekko kuhli]
MQERLFLMSLSAASTKGEIKRDERVAVLATAGTKKFFSLLSITSYSSYAFHKVSIVVYNNFTALLVDIIGNSTSFLTEIFKSTSILSVSQSNDTDCVYICVMSGRTGRNLSDLWEAVEKSPVINYTFSGNMSDLLDLDSILPNLIPLREEAEKVLSYTAQGAWTFKIEGYDISPGVPPVRTPKMSVQPQTIAPKGDEAVSPRFTTWRKTVGLKGSEPSSFQMSSWLQAGASKEWEIPPTKAVLSPAPVTSYDVPPGTQPVPSEYTGCEEPIQEQRLFENMKKRSFILLSYC